MLSLSLNILYLSLYLEWKLKKSIKSQMDSISKGFYQIVPFELAKMFDSNGLQVYLNLSYMK